MKVFVTKYALTHGIFAVEAEKDKADPSLVRVKNGGKGLRELTGHDWHRTRAQAIARAEEMRVLKSMSLIRQSDRLAAMSF